MGSASGGGQPRAGSPAFLTLDDRVPVPIRELLLEADGCVSNGFLTGGTACAQRAVDTVLRLEKAEGSAYDARVRTLSDKHPAIPQLIITILLQFGDVGAREPARLTPGNLEVLVTALKAMVYEIFVVGPERGERLQYVRRLLEAAERKTLTLSDLVAPAAAASSTLDSLTRKPAVSAAATAGSVPASSPPLVVPRTS
jgi:hypothetical protein